MSETQGVRPPVRTEKATIAAQEWHAERAIDDPAKLARAARIVRAALARRRLSIEDLTPPAGGAAA